MCWSWPDPAAKPAPRRCAVWRPCVAGAGLVTVASTESAIPVIASHAPELMTEPLPETVIGAISLSAVRFRRLACIARDKTVLAIGPGLATDLETVMVVRRALRNSAQPMVIDADGLNALAGTEGAEQGCAS